MYQAADFYRAIDSFAPFHTAEAWDNAGLLIGGMERPANRALLALDLTSAVLEEALRLDVNLVITHHPVIFQPMSRLEAGSLVYRAVREEVSVISAHTNLDLAEGGVNDALAACIGLRETSPLDPVSGLGRIGRLDAAMPPEAFAAFVKERLAAKGLRFVPGRCDVERVAVCGGSSGGELARAARQGAQAFVTADVKHNQLLDAWELGVTLVDGGHFATENVVIPPLRDRLLSRLPDAIIYLSETCSDNAQYL